MTFAKMPRAGSFCIKLISIFLIPTFMLSNIVYAAPTTDSVKAPSQNLTVTNPEGIVIPREFGLVKTKFTGKDDRLVIHIQDAHCNYEAQSNIVKILETLHKNYNVSLVSVEGADGVIDTSWFKAFPDDEVRKEVADYFMKKGEITGPEFLSITTDYNIKLFGAETRSYYIDNLNAFTSSYPLKEQTEKYLNSIKSALNKLKTLIYSEDLKLMDAKYQDYDSKKLQFNDYVKFLQVEAEKAKINLRAYENFFKLVSVLVYEKKIDFTVTDKERSALIDSISKDMPKETLTELVNKSLEFKTGKISSADYYAYLKKLAIDNGTDLAKDYPNLYNYIIYNSVYSKIENEKLFNDIKKLEGDIKEKLFTTDDQRTLEKLSRHIEILIGLVNIKLLNGDYEYFEANKAEFSHEIFSDFIKKKTIQYGLAYEMDDPNDAVAKALPKLEDFYSIAIKRDKALVDNTLGQMGKDKARVAVLVTGGFHSEGMSKLLEKQGVSYMVICPSITKDLPTPYIQILTNQKTPLSDILVTPVHASEGQGVEKIEALAPPLRTELATMNDKELEAFLKAVKGSSDLEAAVEQLKNDWYKISVNGVRVGNVEVVKGYIEHMRNGVGGVSGSTTIIVDNMMKGLKASLDELGVSQAERAKIKAAIQKAVSQIPSLQNRMVQEASRVQARRVVANRTSPGTKAVGPGTDRLTKTQNDAFNNMLRQSFAEGTYSIVKASELGMNIPGAPDFQFCVHYGLEARIDKYNREHSGVNLPNDRVCAGRGGAEFQHNLWQAHISDYRFSYLIRQKDIGLEVLRTIAVHEDAHIAISNGRLVNNSGTDEENFVDHYVLGANTSDRLTELGNKTIRQLLSDIDNQRKNDTVYNMEATLLTDTDYGTAIINDIASLSKNITGAYLANDLDKAQALSAELESYVKKVYAIMSRIDEAKTLLTRPYKGFGVVVISSTTPGEAEHQQEVIDKLLDGVKYENKFLGNKVCVLSVCDESEGGQIVGQENTWKKATEEAFDKWLGKNGVKKTKTLKQLEADGDVNVATFHNGGKGERFATAGLAFNLSRADQPLIWTMTNAKGEEIEVTLLEGIILTFSANAERTIKGRQDEIWANQICIPTSDLSRRNYHIDKFAVAVPENAPGKDLFDYGTFIVDGNGKIIKFLANKVLTIKDENGQYVRNPKYGKDYDDLIEAAKKGRAFFDYGSLSLSPEMAEALHDYWKNVKHVFDVMEQNGGRADKGRDIDPKLIQIIVPLVNGLGSLNGKPLPEGLPKASELSHMLPSNEKTKIMDKAYAELLPLMEDKFKAALESIYKKDKDGVLDAVEFFILYRDTVFKDLSKVVGYTDLGTDSLWFAYKRLLDMGNEKFLMLSDINGSVFEIGPKGEIIMVREKPERWDNVKSVAARRLRGIKADNVSSFELMGKKVTLSAEEMREGRFITISGKKKKAAGAPSEGVWVIGSLIKGKTVLLPGSSIKYSVINNSQGLIDADHSYLESTTTSKSIKAVNSILVKIIDDVGIDVKGKALADAYRVDKEKGLKIRMETLPGYDPKPVYTTYDSSEKKSKVLIEHADGTKTEFKLVDGSKASEFNLLDASGKVVGKYTRAIVRMDHPVFQANNTVWYETTSNKDISVTLDGRPAVMTVEIKNVAPVEGVLYYDTLELLSGALSANIEKALKGMLEQKEYYGDAKGKFLARPESDAVRFGNNTMSFYEIRALDCDRKKNDTIEDTLRAKTLIEGGMMNALAQHLVKMDAASELTEDFMKEFMPFVRKHIKTPLISERRTAINNMIAAGIIPASKIAPRVYRILFNVSEHLSEHESFMLKKYPGVLPKAGQSPSTGIVHLDIGLIERNEEYEHNIENFPMGPFGTSGIRSTIEFLHSISNDAIAQGLVSFFTETDKSREHDPIGLAGDLRPNTGAPFKSNGAMLEAIAVGLIKSHRTIYNAGRVPTGAITLAGILKHIQTIMNTASHNPFDEVMGYYNGFKPTRAAGEVLKGDERSILAHVREMMEIEYRLSRDNSIYGKDGEYKKEGLTPEQRHLIERAKAALSSVVQEVSDMYRNRYLEAFGPTALNGSVTGFWKHTAVGRELIPGVIKDIGGHVYGIGKRESWDMVVDTEDIKPKTAQEAQRLTKWLKDSLTKLSDDIASTDIVGLNSVSFVEAVRTKLSADPETLDLFNQVLGYLPHDALSYDASGVRKTLSGIARNDSKNFQGLDTTDGDSDRPGLFDENGIFNYGDKLDYLACEYIRESCAMIRPMHVVVTATVNEKVIKRFESLGIKVHKVQIGSPYVVKKIQEIVADNPTAIVVGFERNGGFLVGTELEFENGRKIEPLPTRDSTFPLICAHIIATREGKTISALIADRFSGEFSSFSWSGLVDNDTKDTPFAKEWASQYTAPMGQAIMRDFAPPLDTAPDKRVIEVTFGEHIKYDTFDGDTGDAQNKIINGRKLSDIMQEIRSRLKGYFPNELIPGEIVKINYLDGVRVYFGNGEIVHMRPSGNAPQWRIYAEAADLERAKAIIDMRLVAYPNIIRDFVAKAAEMRKTTRFTPKSIEEIKKLVGLSKIANEKKLWEMTFGDKGQHREEETMLFTHDSLTLRSYRIYNMHDPSNRKEVDRRITYYPNDLKNKRRVEIVETVNGAVTVNVSVTGENAFVDIGKAIDRNVPIMIWKAPFNKDASLGLVQVDQDFPVMSDDVMMELEWNGVSFLHLFNVMPSSIISAEPLLWGNVFNFQKIFGTVSDAEKGRVASTRTSAMPSPGEFGVSPIARNEGNLTPYITQTIDTIRVYVQNGQVDEEVLRTLAAQIYRNNVKVGPQGQPAIDQSLNSSDYAIIERIIEGVKNRLAAEERAQTSRMADSLEVVSSTINVEASLDALFNNQPASLPESEILGMLQTEVNDYLKSYSKITNKDDLKRYFRLVAERALNIDDIETSRGLQIMAGQALAIISLIEDGTKNAEMLRVTADPLDMVTAKDKDGNDRAPSYLSASSIKGREISATEGDATKLHWRGVEGITKLGVTLNNDGTRVTKVGPNISADAIYDKEKFASQSPKMVMYVMLHIGGYHTTVFLHDYIPGTIQHTSTGAGHLQNDAMDIKYVVSGRGLQLNKVNVSVITQRLEKGTWAVAYPNNIDEIVNFGGLVFKDFSFKVPGVAPQALTATVPYYAVTVNDQEVFVANGANLLSLTFSTITAPVGNVSIRDFYVYSDAERFRDMPGETMSTEKPVIATPDQVARAAQAVKIAEAAQPIISRPTDSPVLKKYAWAGTGISRLLGMAVQKVAEIWFNSTQKDGVSKVPGTDVALAEAVTANSERMLGPGMTTKPVFNKILGKDESQPQIVHIGFNSKIGNGQQFIGLMIREREAVRALLQEISKYKTTQDSFDLDFKAPYERWVSAEIRVGWRTLVTPEFPNNIIEKLDAIRKIRAELVSYMNEVKLEPGQVIISPVGYIHSIVGSHQTHPLMNPTETNKPHPQAKNEAWYIISDGQGGMLYFEPQQTSNTTYSPFDFPTPIVWDAAKNAPNVRKDFLNDKKEIENLKALLRPGESLPADEEGVIRLMAERTMKFEATIPEDFIVNDRVMDATPEYGNPVRATVERLIHGSYPVMETPPFNLERISLTGEGVNSPASIKDSPIKDSFHELTVVKGEVVVVIEGKEEVLPAGSTIFVPAANKTPIEIKSNGEAEVLKTYPGKPRSEKVEMTASEIVAIENKDTGHIKYLSGTLASKEMEAMLKSLDVDDGFIINAIDTEVEDSRGTIQSAQAFVAQEAGDRIINIRGSGTVLLDAIQKAIAEHQGRIKAVVTTTPDQKTAASAMQYGSVVNVQQLKDNKGRYMPVPGLQDLALRIAVASVLYKDKVTSEYTKDGARFVFQALDRIALAPDNKPFTVIDVLDLLKKGFFRILPRIVPVDLAAAREAYIAAKAALQSL